MNIKKVALGLTMISLFCRTPRKLPVRYYYMKSFLDFFGDKGWFDSSMFDEKEMVFSILEISCREMDKDIDKQTTSKGSTEKIT